MTEATTCSEDTLIGSERAQLLAFVHDNRTEVVALLDGPHRGAGAGPAGALGDHVAGHRQALRVRGAVWFHVSLAGRSRGRSGSRRLPTTAACSTTPTLESVLAGYRAAWAEADEIAAPYDLDDLRAHNRRGPLTLRWIYVHMVEELARHAGHGDILREQVLAAG